MTVNGDTVCKLLQTFPLLLILAHSNKRCLHTHLVYKQPVPTASTEYYQTLDAIFHSLFANKHDCHGGHGKDGSILEKRSGYSDYSGHSPCYAIYNAGHGYGSGHGHSSGHGYGSGYGNGYGSGHAHKYGTGYTGIGYETTHASGHGYGLGHGYGSDHGYTTDYNHGTNYATGYGTTYGYPIYKLTSVDTNNDKIPNKIYNVNNHKYKVVLRKPHYHHHRHHHRRKKYQNLEEISCQTKEGVMGACLLIEDCPEYGDGIENLSKNDSCISNGTQEMVCCPDFEMNKALLTESSREMTTETPEGVVSDDDIRTAMKLLCEILGLPGCEKQDENDEDARDINPSHELLKSNIAEILEKSKENNVFLPKTELLLPPYCGNYKEKLRDSNTLPVEDIPWMVLLGYKSKNDTAWLCGGSLISNNHVLTAAHCIHGYEDILFTVKISNNNKNIPIKEMIMHDEYNRTAQINDIGILILNIYEDSDTIINPVCLPVESEFRGRYLVQSKPYVITWDKNLKGNEDVKISINQVSISSTASRCNKAFPKRTIDRRVICAGLGRAGKSLCRRDNGTPLVVPMLNNANETFYTQIGVMSFGKKCAENSVPGIYSRLTYFLPWIKKIVLGKNIKDENMQ